MGTYVPLSGGSLQADEAASQSLHKRFVSVGGSNAHHRRAKTRQAWVRGLDRYRSGD